MSQQPIPSTALILRRRNQVFMVRRRPESRFMGRFHSFVGGKIDGDDSVPSVDNVPLGATSGQIVSCFREAFEETGWLAHPQAPAPNDLATQRRDLLAGRITFSKLLIELNLSLDASSIAPAGIWITPAFQQIRFESFYFITDVPDGIDLSIHEAEHDTGDWWEPATALADWDNGRLTLPPPVVHSLRQLTANHSDDSTLYAALNRPPQIYGKPGKRIEFRGGIQLVPLTSDTLPPATHTNCYLVGRERYALIDPATIHEADRKLLLDYIGHLRDDKMEPAAVILTHQHHDHTSAARWLHETLNIPIMASAITRDLLTSTCPVHEIIDDGQILDFGGPWKLRAIATPGHAPGHLCFLETHTGTLFAGDMISGHGTILISPGDGGNMIHYLESLKNLIDNFEYDLLLPAHGGSIGDAKGKLQELIDHRQWRENKLLAVANAKFDGLDDLVNRTYDDVDERALPFAHLSTLAILEKLRTEGRLPDGCHL